MHIPHSLEQELGRRTGEIEDTDNATKDHAETMKKDEDHQGSQQNRIQQEVENKHRESYPSRPIEEQGYRQKARKIDQQHREKDERQTKPTQPGRERELWGYIGLTEYNPKTTRWECRYEHCENTRTH